MIKTRAQLEKDEEKILAPYAFKSSATAGRVHEEPVGPFRLPFQRDRDRVMHCKSFRRLQAKTQVFVAYYGDHYRDRLTHSIEVSQIARGLSRTLGLNEDLAECISLAHDLGHTPFGHGGEDAISEIMHQYGKKFEHNEQSRRILEKLETGYPNFDGLNVSKEVLDGMLKHNPHAAEAFSEFEIYPHLEAQVADISDEIAYLSHDIDDGLRSGLINIEQVQDFQIWKSTEKIIMDRYKVEIPDLDSQKVEKYRNRIISKMISQMIKDAQKTASDNIQKNNINNVEDIRAYKGKLVTFSAELTPQVQELRTFLLQNFYSHKDVASQIKKGQNIIRKLFEYYFDQPDKMPIHYKKFIEIGESKEVVVKDYIAGMTDHYAEEKYAEIQS